MSKRAAPEEEGSVASSELGRPRAGVPSKTSQLCASADGRRAVTWMVQRNGVFVYANANGIKQDVPDAIAAAFARVYDNPLYLDIHRCVSTTTSDGHAKATFPSKVGAGFSQGMIDAVADVYSGQQKKADWHLLVQAFDVITARVNPDGGAAAAGMTAAELDESFETHPVMALGMLASHLRPGLGFCGKLDAVIVGSTTYESLEVVTESTLFNTSRDVDDVAFNDVVMCAESLRLNLPTCRCYGRLSGGPHCSLWKKTVRAAPSKALLTIIASRGGGVAAPIVRGTFNNINDTSYRI